MGPIKKIKKTPKPTVKQTEDVVEKVETPKPTKKEVKPKKRKAKALPKAEEQTTESVEPKPKKKKTLKKKTIAESAPADAYVPGMLSSIFGKESNTEAIDETALKCLEGESKITVEKKVYKKGEKPVDRTVQRANRIMKKPHGDEDNNRTLFIGNAPISATIKSIRALFRDYGKIDTIRMRGVAPAKETLSKRVCNTKRKFHWNQQSLIFYIKYMEEESVQKALEKNGEVVDGHKLRVSTVAGKKNYDKNKTVYIGNLTFTAQEDDIAKLFEEKVGPVDFVRLTRDKDTGVGKGFGFVNFKKTASVDIALALSDVVYQKRVLRITKLMKKNQIQKSSMLFKKQAKATAKAKKESHIDNFKFSTKEKKIRTEEQVGKRKLKKTVQKAIKRRHAAKAGKSIMN